MRNFMEQKRPAVHLQSENTIDELLSALNASLPRFSNLQGVVGVLLDGGLSRGYGDFLSEIDIVIYVDAPSFEELQGGNCPFPLGIGKLDGYLYDIKLLNYEDETMREYDAVALWDLSYAKILYDPEGKMAAFLRQKLSKPLDASYAGGFLWDAYWHYKLAGNIWIHRQDTLQGHHVLNLALPPLLRALFVVNNEYIPHDKWLIHMSRSLSWKPDHWDVLLEGAMRTGDCSIQSLLDRQRYIEAVYKSINQYICDMTDFHCQLDFTQKQSYETLLKLTERNVYTIEEWTALQSLDALNYEPIHSLFFRRGNKIYFNEGHLLTLKPEDMYVWMYEIADAVRKVRSEQAPEKSIP